MGLSGPKKQPIALAMLRGTYRKDRGARNPATPAAEIPTCPPQLTDEAKREWRRVGKELLACGLISKLDRAALSAYCQAWSDWVEALEKLKVEGKVVKSPNNYPMLNPWLSIANKANEQMRYYLSEFGMSPATRAKVEALPVPTGGDLARQQKRALLFGEGNGKLAKYINHSPEDEERAKEARFFGDN